MFGEAGQKHGDERAVVIERKPGSLPKAAADRCTEATIIRIVLRELFNPKFAFLRYDVSEHCPVSCTCLHSVLFEAYHAFMAGMRQKGEKRQHLPFAQLAATVEVRKTHKRLFKCATR